MWMKRVAAERNVLLPERSCDAVLLQQNRIHKICFRVGKIGIKSK